MTNFEKIKAMSKEEKREKLIEYFSKWASIGDSYIFDLIRVKSAFAIGTMHLDDFVEWDDFRICELVDEFIEWLEMEAEEV